MGLGVDTMGAYVVLVPLRESPGQDLLRTAAPRVSRSPLIFVASSSTCRFELVECSNFSSLETTESSRL